MDIPPAPRELNDIGRVAWAFSRSGRIKIQDKLASGWTQLNFCLHRIETGDLCSIHPSKEQLNHHTRISKHFVPPEVKQRLKVEASQMLKSAKRNNSGSLTSLPLEPNTNSVQISTNFDRGSRERMDYRRSGSRDGDDYRRQSSKDDRYYDSRESYHRSRHDRSPRTSPGRSPRRSASPNAYPSTSRERSPRRRSGSPSRSRRSPPHSSYSRPRSGSPGGRRNYSSPPRGDNKWTYRGNPKIIGFGNNRYCSGKEHNIEIKKSFSCNHCGAVFKDQMKYIEHNKYRYKHSICRTEETTSGRSSGSQGSSRSERRRSGETLECRRSSEDVIDVIDDEPPRGAYYRQESSSKIQDRKRSTERKEVPEILIESSPSDNSDVDSADNTNRDLAGLTTIDSTEDEEVEEIRMDIRAADQQSNSRSAQRDSQLPLPVAARANPSQSFAGTLPQKGPSLPKPVSAGQSSGFGVAPRTSTMPSLPRPVNSSISSTVAVSKQNLPALSMHVPHSIRSADVGSRNVPTVNTSTSSRISEESLNTVSLGSRTALSFLVSPPRLPELPGTADIQSALEESLNEHLAASSEKHTKRPVESSMDTSAEIENTKGTASEPTSAVDKLDFYLSKKGKKDYLSDRNKPEKSSKSPSADNDNMEIDASDNNEKSISDKINQKMRERRSQDGPTLGLSSLNLYGPENESLQTKKIQEKNKSKNISKGIRQNTPKKSSNTQTSKSPTNVSKNITKSGFPSEKESEANNQEIINAEYNNLENQVDVLPDSSACDEIESKIDIDRPDIITTRCTAIRDDSVDAILAQIEKQGDENYENQKINLDELKKLHAEVKDIKNPCQLNLGTEQDIDTNKDQSTDLPAETIPEQASPASRDSSSPSSRASSPPPPPSRESSVNSSHSQESDKSSKRSNARSYSKTPSPRSPPESINPPIFSENPPELDQDETEDNEMESLADNIDLDELNDEEGSDNETSAIEADSTSSAGPENDSSEDVERNSTLEDSNEAVRAILNKLTSQKFETLVKQIQELPIDTKEKMESAMELVFEKAVDEPASSVAYAQMCCNLAQREISDGEEKVKFRTILIRRVQKEFDKDYMKDVDMELKKKSEDPSLSKAERKMAREEFETQERKVRKRFLGNIRFLGELYNLQLLTLNIMHDCVNTLISKTDEESLERFCKLITTVGSHFDKETNVVLTNRKEGNISKINMEKKYPAVKPIQLYFDRMYEIIEKRTISSRVRCLMQDVIDLKKASWKKRREEAGPKKIDQIHEVEEDARSPAAVVEPGITFDHEGVDPKSGNTFKYHILESVPGYYTKCIVENIDDIEFADSTDSDDSDQDDSEMETFKVVYPEREIVVTDNRDMECGECGTQFIGAENFRLDLKDFSDVFYCLCGKKYRFPSSVGKPSGIEAAQRQ